MMEMQTSSNDEIHLVYEFYPPDILCGKSRLCVNHPGTREFRMTIDQYAKRYHDAENKQDRMDMTKEIWEVLARRSSRFLKWSDKYNTWEEISVLAARDKISHALRFANRGNVSAAQKKKKSKKDKKESCSSSKKVGRSHRRLGSDSSSNTEYSFESNAAHVTTATASKKADKSIDEFDPRLWQHLNTTTTLKPVEEPLHNSYSTASTAAMDMSASSHAAQLDRSEQAHNTELDCLLEEPLMEFDFDRNMSNMSNLPDFQ